MRKAALPVVFDGQKTCGVSALIFPDVTFSQLASKFRESLLVNKVKKVA